MANEQLPQDPNQPIDPAAEGLNSHQQFTADLMAAAEGMDGIAVPSVDQFDQARALAQELKPGGQGFHLNGKRVNQAAAEAVELAGDPNRWEMDADVEAQWRAVADAKHVSELPADMRAYVGKKDIYEPGNSILGRAHQEANARLALHDHLKAEEAARQAQAAEAAAEASAQAEQLAAERRAADMDKERQRVYDQEHARVMARSAREVEAKVDAAVAHIDRNNPDAMRLLESTRAKFRAGFERDASMEAHASASAAADAREAHINENGGIDELDKINFKDRMGVGSGKDKAGEKSSDVRVVDNRSEEAKARVWSKDLDVSFTEWANATDAERDEMIARAEVAKAQAEAAAGDIVEVEADNGEDDIAEDDDAELDDEDAEADDDDDEDEAAEEGAPAEENGRRFQFDAARARQIIAEAVARWRRQYGPRATAEAEGGDDGEGQLGPDGTLILPAVEDPTPNGLRARLGRLVERARAYYGDEERGRNRKAREIVIGAGALVGAGVGIFLASRGMSGVESVIFGGPIPGFGSNKSGSGPETARHAHQQYLEMREGSNPWAVAKDYLVNHGNRHPSNAQIEAEDARIGRFYMAAHHLGQYSWDAWTKIATKLPVGKLRVK